MFDRVIQQAVLQQLQPLWDPTFSEHSYGFRPGRSAHQAVAQAQAYVIEGYQFVVDFDLAKFFDRVNHDRLMAAVAKRVDDKRVLRLIREFLTAGVLIDGLLEASLQGTPQGGPLSPLLSNLVLDELDRELGRRGHRFVRYADDCNIYVRSEAAGHRVMSSITRFIERRLKLQVNAEKSAVGRPWQRSFLGYTIRGETELRRCVAEKALARFKKPGEGTDAAFAWRQPGAGDQRPEPIPTRLGRIFRIQPVARTINARCLGEAQVALPCLGAMEDDASAHCGTVSSRGRQVGGVRGVPSCQRAVAAEFL